MKCVWEQYVLLSKFCIARDEKFLNLSFWQRGGFALHLDKERVYYGEHVLINLVSIKLILEFLLFQKHAKTTMLSWVMSLLSWRFHFAEGPC